MHAHNEMEAVLDTLQEDLSIIDINVEFAFEGIMNEDASLDIDIIILTVPVGFEGNWDTFPSVGVGMAESFTDSLDNSLGQNVRLKDY